MSDMNPTGKGFEADSVEVIYEVIEGRDFVSAVGGRLSIKTPGFYDVKASCTSTITENTSPYDNRIGVYGFSMFGRNVIDTPNIGGPDVGTSATSSIGYAASGEIAFNPYMPFDVAAPKVLFNVGYVAKHVVRVKSVVDLTIRKISML